MTMLPSERATLIIGLVNDKGPRFQNGEQWGEHILEELKEEIGLQIQWDREKEADEKTAVAEATFKKLGKPKDDEILHILVSPPVSTALMEGIRDFFVERGIDEDKLLITATDIWLKKLSVADLELFKRRIDSLITATKELP